MSFDWKKIISINSDQRLAFDALSRQLFKKEFESEGEYMPMGGEGDSQHGVEAIVLKPNKDEIGIQAKWFPDGGLAGNANAGKRRQVKSSLKLSSDKRKNLKTWILSIPRNLEADDRKWVYEDLQKEFPKIKLVLWEEDQLIELLAKSENVGLRAWFFGEMDFSPEWFEEKINSKIEIISRKYKPSLHVEGNADQSIQFMLGNNELVESLQKRQRGLSEWLGQLKSMQEGIKPKTAHKKVKDLAGEMDKKLSAFYSDLESYTKEVDRLVDLLSKGDMAAASAMGFGYGVDIFTDVDGTDDYRQPELLKLAGSIAHGGQSIDLKIGDIQINFTKVHWLEDKKNFEVKQGENNKEINVLLKPEFLEVTRGELLKEFKKINKNLGRIPDLDIKLKDFLEQEFSSFSKDLDKLSDKVGEILSHFDEFHNQVHLIKQDFDYFKQREIIFFANPGIGKTHLILKACENQVEQKKPAILILGSHVSNEHYLKQQVMDLLEIKNGYTWSQVIQGLEAYAEANKSRILFAFDALNESPYWENIVSEGLHELIGPLLNSPWFGVVLSARMSYATPLFGSEHPENSYVLQNDMDIDEYRKVYFKEYKLKFLNPSPSMRRQLNDRFFVTLLCSVYGNKSLEKIKEISLKNLNVNDLFEAYLLKVDLNVCKTLGAPTGCQLIRSKLLKLCGHMFENNVMQLPKYKALELIEGKEPSLVRNIDSWVHCMVNEGLLVDFSWKDGIEILEFSHQRIGEYLMASFIVENRNQTEVEEQIRIHSNHPRVIDVLELVGTLTPHTIKKHLYEFLPPDALRDSAQIGAFLELKTEDITEKEINWLVTYFKSSSGEKKSELLSRLVYTALYEDYPFNSDFTSVLLNTLSLKERDLVWTEWLRKNTSSMGFMEKYLSQVEEALKNDDLSKEKGILASKYTRWFLTSTNKEIRDRATRLLYWFGRKYPSELLSITIESLAINDPYVPERLLASSYGVAMAMYKEKNFVNEVLAVYVKNLYLKMFAASAEFATTHILMRDYARRTIELALLMDSAILNSAQKKRTKPPFKDGGIRKWGESEDKNEHEYRDGNHPFGFDWGNYTLGRLVPGRSPYQKPEEFKKVERQIFWRLYELGYSLREFGEIDKDIARSDRSMRSDVPGKTERYGKKYCWIAFYELAGYRDDKGLLRDRYGDVRLSDKDIDPSFPEKVSDINLVTKSFIDNKLSILKWVKEDSPFKIDEFLKREGMNGENGKWILLDGMFSEEDKAKNKGVLVNISGLIVDKKNAEELARLYVNDKDRSGERDSEIPDSPSDYYTFAGEIPWCETFPYIEYSQEMEFMVGDKVLTKKIEMPKIKFIFKDFSKDKKGKEEKDDSDDIDMEMQEVTDYEEMEKQGIIKKIPVMTPVRNYSWEGYHSVVNQEGGAKVINKEISTYLGLWIQPQSFNMLDKDGKLASFSIEHESVWRNGSQFVYLREDLLKEYLAKNNKSLVWLIWGERQFEPTGDNFSNEIEAFRKKYGGSSSRYKQAIVYK